MSERTRAVPRIDPTGDDFLGNAGNNYAIPPDNPNFDAGSEATLYSIRTRRPFQMNHDPASGLMVFDDVADDSRAEINIV